MDTRVIDFIQKKYNVESLDPVFISDSTNNIPSKMLFKLNNTLCYSFMDYDVNGYNNDHLYMKRVFNGNMHDTNSGIKFMKSLEVNVNVVDDTVGFNNILSQRFCLSDKKDNVKELRRRVATIIDKFFHGDIEPENVSDANMYNDKLSVQYKIGNVQIYSTYNKHTMMTEYFVGIPYKAILKVS